MNDFLDSLKSDLLDRRIVPILALVAVALAAALGYALLSGGGSSTPTPATLSPAPAGATSGLPVSQVQSGTAQPVAETTSGTAHRSGAATTRNPFAPLPGTNTSSAAAKTGAESSASAGPEASKTTESGSSSGSSGTTAPTSEANKPATKKTAKTTYRVAVRFGVAPAGTPAPSAQLTPYEDLKRQQPLPDAKAPVLVFRGVVAGGKSATFTLVGEAIPHGSAKCLPSAAQCQAIDLKVGASEEFEYAPLGEAPINYELEVVKIEPVKAKAAGVASAASAADAFVGESKAGLKILREEGLTEIPGLRYSTDGSVLVFKRAEHALATRAHASAWGGAL